MKVLLALILVASMAACHAGRVRCESHLERINPVVAIGDDSSGANEPAAGTQK